MYSSLGVMVLADLSRGGGGAEHEAQDSSLTWHCSSASWRFRFPGSVELSVGVLLFTASESPAGACFFIMVFIIAIAALHVHEQ